MTLLTTPIGMSGGARTSAPPAVNTRSPTTIRPSAGLSSSRSTWGRLAGPRPSNWPESRCSVMSIVAVVVVVDRRWRRGGAVGGRSVVAGGTLTSGGDVGGTAGSTTTCRAPTRRHRRRRRRRRRGRRRRRRAGDDLDRGRVVGVGDQHDVRLVRQQRGGDLADEPARRDDGHADLDAVLAALVDLDDLVEVARAHADHRGRDARVVAERRQVPLGEQLLLRLDRGLGGDLVGALGGELVAQAVVLVARPPPTRVIPRHALTTGSSPRRPPTPTAPSPCGSPCGRRRRRRCRAGRA